MHKDSNHSLVAFGFCLYFIGVLVFLCGSKAWGFVLYPLAEVSPSPSGSFVMALELPCLDARKSQCTWRLILGISFNHPSEVYFTTRIMLSRLIGLCKNIFICQTKYCYLFLKQKQVNHMAKCFITCFFLNWPILNNICEYVIFIK